MKRILPFLVLVLGLSNAWGQVPPAAVANRMQRYIDSIVQVLDAPGATLTIHQVGAWRSTWTSGYAHYAPDDDMTANHKMRVSAITGTMTSTAILKLASENKLSLDDTIGLWLPPSIVGYIPFRSRITVRHLLRHTSGIADYVSDTASQMVTALLTNPTKYFSVQYIMDNHFIRLLPGTQPVSTEHRFSNTNYLLLGPIIEAASGKPYKQYIKEDVLGFLSMPNTYFPANNAFDITSPAMHGYFLNANQQLVNVTGINPSWIGAGGEAISTTDDLVTYFKALQDGQIIPQAWVDSMLVVNKVRPNFGYGLWQITIGTNKWFGLAGRIFGYNTNLYYCPQLKAYVSMGINIDNATPDIYLAGIDKYLRQLARTTATARYTKTDAQLIPQPAEGKLVLNLTPSNKPVAISIYNLPGAKMMENPAYMPGTEISIEALPAGIYFLRYSTGGEPKALRFVKK